MRARNYQTRGEDLTWFGSNVKSRRQVKQKEPTGILFCGFRKKQARFRYAPKSFSELHCGLWEPLCDRSRTIASTRTGSQSRSYSPCWHAQIQMGFACLADQLAVKIRVQPIGSLVRIVPARAVSRGQHCVRANGITHWVLAHTYVGGDIIYCSM